MCTAAENFVSIQEELEKKALKEGSQTQTFYVANATEDGQAVSKNQMQNFVNETNNSTLAMRYLHFGLLLRSHRLCNIH